MMTEALGVGGLEIAYGERREAFCQGLGKDGYKPNDQFFELDAGELYGPDFPQKYDGKLIKVLWNSLIRVPPFRYRVIFMRRPKDEIQASCKATFGNVPDDILNDSFELHMEKIVSILRDRRSVVSLDEIWYGDVVSNPLAVFNAIDWPIDARKAATVPTKDKYRHRA
jgi:hypothetical protein